VARARTVWRCQSCGASAPKWYGRCPDCGEYGTFVEEAEIIAGTRGRGSSARPAARVSLADVGHEEESRTSTGVSELDRVLGGGFVTGSLVLLGGEPGIGKSTILLQVASLVAESGGRVLYVCGEESPGQVGLRARRTGSATAGVELMPETDMAALEAAVREQPPDLLVVDSIQTAFDPELTGAPGSVGQVRAATARLMRIAKDLGVTTVLVGHVTKDGAIAGPRVLEHMVDTVLYFEGDRDHAFRVVRAVKNRFGPVSEIGIFEMTERGLVPVGDPAAMLLGERGSAVPGSVVMAAMEGSRPLLVEIQALVTPTYLQVPRRLATGVDTGRLLQVIAVLERRGGLSFSGYDVYVSVAGGVRVAEPAIDLPLAVALASALKDRAVPLDVVAFGEVALTGLVRPVAHTEARAREAARQGLTRLVASVPASVTLPDGVRRSPVTGVSDLVGLVG
jgi:DNA repair protein RadA/Sms